MAMRVPSSDIATEYPDISSVASPSMSKPSWLVDITVGDAVIAFDAAESPIVFTALMVTE